MPCIKNIAVMGDRVSLTVDGQPLECTFDQMRALPELLEALKDVLRIARAASIGISGNQPRIARAEAAIAKAEGKP